MHDANEVYYYVTKRSVTILHNGYKYHKKMQFKGGTVTWRCSKCRRKKCPGTISIINDNTIVKRRPHSDNCIPDYGLNEELLLIGRAQAAIRMKAQLNDDSEEEYLDDPIKLFDFEHERVHFGSQPLQCNNMSTYLPHRSEDGILIDNNTQLPESSDGPNINTENARESDCLPSCVKLVDCGKYPWYYKKYSQQISNKLSIFNLVSDDDCEEDISGDNSDCIIVEDIIQHLDQNIKDYSSKILPEINCKTALEKRQETIKLKEDIEIQIALSLKNTAEIDLKRNKGLIGIKITQKPVIANCLYLPNDVNIENNKINKRSANADEIVKNLPVQFSLGEMFQKLLERLITKKNNVQPRKNKPKPIKLNKSSGNQKSDPKTGICKSSSLPNKVKGPSVEAKKTITNQVNTNDKLVSELAVSQLNQKEKHKKCAKQAEEPISFNQNSPKRYAEDNGEPNSPILKCSINLAKKNRSLSKITIDNKNRDIHIIKTFSDTTVDDNKNVNRVVGVRSTERETENKASKHDQIPNLVNSMLADNKEAENLHKIQSVDNNIGQLSENVEIYTKSFINDKFNDNNSKININAQKMNQPNIKNVVQNSVTGAATNSLTINQCAPSTNVVRPQFKQSVATNNCSDTSPFTNGFKQNLLSSNGSGNVMNLKNIKASNSTAHNSNGSAIILRPMVPVRAQFNHYTLKEAPRMSLQPRFYQNPFIANYHRPPLPLPDYRLNPRSVNCNTPNYRFPTPQEIGYPPQYYPRQLRPVHYNGRNDQHKNLPHWFQQSSQQHKKYSNPTPALQNLMNTKSELDTRSSNTSQLKNDVSLRNSIGNSNMVLPEKKISDPRMLSLESGDTDLVVSKTKMLEVLDSATYNLENDITENNLTEKVQAPVNILKMPIVASKLDLTNKDDYRKLIEQQRDSTKNLLSNSTSELVGKKVKMPDSTSNDLKRSIDDSQEKVQEPTNQFKRPKINKPDQCNEDYKKQGEGYSPPILPIPTFQNILHRAKKNVQKQDQRNVTVSVINVEEINENGKRTLNNTPQGNSRKVNAGRKISIEEYKIRKLQMNRHQFNNTNNNVCRKGNDKNNHKIHNIRMYNNVDRCSTETDLGYDSDSTVIL